MPYYREPQKTWRRVAALVLLAFWTPVMQCTEMLTRVTANWDGEGKRPPIVHVIVRFMLAVMWRGSGPWDRLRRQRWSRWCQGSREGSVSLLSKRKSITQLLPKLHLALGGLQAFCHVPGQDQARFADWAFRNLSQARLKVFETLGEIVEAEV